jgi:serine protease Do
MSHPIRLGLVLCLVAATITRATGADDAPQGDSSAAATAAASVQQLAKQVRQSVVVITVTGREGTQHGLGTGFVVSADGLIATNLHVIGEARPISVQTADGKTLTVEAVHATDRSRDLAILKVKGEELRALTLADSDKLDDGEPIVVMGNPHGLKYSVVSGVLSGTREINDRKMLQLAVPVEPGNSGGPVLDMQGRVCGIVTMKSLVTQNLGFAAAVNDLKPLLEKPNPVPIERWLTIGALDTKEWQPIGGARWHQRAGRILVDGVGQGFGGRSLCLSRDEAPTVPFELAVRVKLGDESGAAGLAWHSDGGDKHYGFYPTGGKLRLTRFDGPDVFHWTVLEEQASDAYQPGEWNQIRVRVESDKLQCYVNGQLVIESSDTQLKPGRIGLVKFRETQAEFKHFKSGHELEDAIPTEMDLTAIQAAIENLPPLDRLEQQHLEELNKTSDFGVEAIRRRAAVLQSRADELRRVASEVHVRSVVEAVRESSGEKLDLLRAALLIARLDEEDVDVDEYIKQVDRIADEIRAKIAENTDEAAKLEAMNQYLFRDNGFHGSRSDYYNRANSYLNRVIDDREGLPITLSVLYIELGKRIGLDLHGVGLPGHFVVRFVPKADKSKLIDVFEGGVVLSREDAEQKVREFTGEPATEEHFRETPPRQILLRMLQNLLGVAQSKGDREAMLRYLEAAIAIEPSLVRERGLRAIVRFETGRKAAAIADLDWIIEQEPDGIDLEQLRAMRQFFLDNRPQPTSALRGN